MRNVTIFNLDHHGGPCYDSAVIWVFARYLCVKVTMEKADRMQQGGVARLQYAPGAGRELKKMNIVSAIKTTVVRLVVAWVRAHRLPIA